MNRSSAKLLFYITGVTCLLILFVLSSPGDRYLSDIKQFEVTDTEPEEAELDPIVTKRARAEYFFRLLRDPETNSIPPRIRSRELRFARTLPTRQQYPITFGTESVSSTSSRLQFTWNSEGPLDIGGRTRALGIDQRDPNTIIAGAVSGGIWKSTDEGATWQLKTDPSQNFSVTSLAQDPTSPDTWYYASGEFRGNSATDRGFEAPYFGTGIYKSTDNGESWTQLPNTDSDATSFNSEYDFISRIVVSPTTGTVLFSSNGFGVYRSIDGQTFSTTPVVGTEAEQIYADVAVAPNGDFAAVISGATFDANSTQPNNPGVYISTDDGVTWTEITPSTFPTGAYRRSVVTFAPSDPNILYIFTLKAEGETTNQGVSFHMIDRSDGTSEDRSANLPNFGDPVGDMETQRGYNMLVSVKPDDPNFVILGAINLFRSVDGFNSPPVDNNGDGLADDTEKDKFWIGGYAKSNDISQYPGQHPDQHIVAFDPTDPNRMWAGHDGGLSLTNDVTASSVSWIDQNNEYITTQFYTAALPQNASDTRIMGGTQDNGTPFFEVQDAQSTNPVSQDISFGDGGYAYFTGSHIFVSRQNGSIVRYTIDNSGNPQDFAFVHPLNAGNQLFIHPYVVDPNDESVMYYPGGTLMWRNTTLDQIPSVNDNTKSGGITEGWSNFRALPDNITGYEITALEMSLNPSDLLYYGASADANDPKIFKLLGARTQSNFQDISIPDDVLDAESGSYVHDIAVDPSNGDEVLVILSNYNTTGIYYTGDGGNTWEAVEGNLTGDNLNPGPSVRSATIIPAEEGTLYLVGTSTGVYSTTSLNGSGTNWVQESPSDIGNSVAEYVTSRISDGKVAIGTHGRGMYTGTFQGTVTIPTVSLNPGQARAGEEVTLTANNFTFNGDTDNIQVNFGGSPAEVLDASSTSLTVQVPRQLKDPESNPSASVSVRVTLSNGERIGGSTFTYLPPAQFRLLQNFPNPFNPTTNIAFDLATESFVVIQVYDILGRKVSEPVSEQFDAGSWARPIDLTNVASGVYFYRVLVFPRQSNNQFSRTAQIIESGKMTFVK